MARSGVIYGPTGSWKTTQVKQFAHYIAETTGKATALLSTDGGGWDPCGTEIKAGMIRPYRVETATLPLVILRKLSQGYWPKNADETNPALIDLGMQDWNEIGGIAVEGWTSISQVIMRYLPDKGISVGGEDRTKLGVFSLPIHINGAVQTESFGSNTRGDFGFTQNQLYGLVMNFISLPVRYVLFTALESKAEDDDRSTIYGPSIAGKKATASCGAWVGDMIHAQDYPKFRKEMVPNPSKPGEMMEQQLIDMTVRYYYRKHPDPATGIPFPAKPRVPPERLADLEKRFPGGYFEPQPDGTNGFGEYLRLCDALGDDQAAVDSLMNWREKMNIKLGRGKK